MDNLKQYLENILFIKWVFEETSELNSYWQQYLEQHHEESENVLAARKILLQFQTVDKSIPEEEKILLYASIIQKIEESQNYNKAKSFYFSLLKYACVAIIFFAVGALLFYRKTTVNPTFFAINSETRISNSHALLVCSNGRNIFIDGKNSLVEYKKSGILLVNKDTISYKRANSINESALNQLIVPWGKTSRIILPDGTKVFLNAGSRLAFPNHFKGNDRSVLLVGEAYFEVKKNPDHNFVVDVNGVKIKDLGTKFNICAYPSDGRVETALVEGKVSIENENSSLFTKDLVLDPGQMASYDRMTNKTNIKEVNVENYSLWINGIMKFESVDLKQVLKKLERYYDIVIDLDDPRIGKIKISGKLQLTENKNEVINRIMHIASVNIVEKRDDLYIVK